MCFFRHVEVTLKIFNTCALPPPFHRNWVAKKSGESCDGGGGGGRALVSKIHQKALNQLRHVEKSTCRKNSMLKSNYVEVGHEQPGYKVLFQLVLEFLSWVVLEFLFLKFRNK